MLWIFVDMNNYISNLTKCICVWLKYMYIKFMYNKHSMFSENEKKIYELKFRELTK